MIRIPHHGMCLLLLLFFTILPDTGHADGVHVFARPSIGLNKFDLLKQYLGTASGGDGSEKYRRVTQAMARKAIADARDIGVRYFRVSATGFSPSAYGRSGDLDLWRRNPGAYWALFDQMMDDLHKHEIRAVLTIVWNVTQFPAMTKETVPMMLRNSNSKSYALLSQYVSDLVGRYRKHPALMFYELTNELNLSADLDSKGRCLRNQPLPLCEPKGNYTTDDVIAFTGRLAELIRSIDTSHPISSGFSVPRAYSEGLRKNPEWRTGRLPQPDTREQYENYLNDIHQKVDIISVHLYGAKESQRFGHQDQVDLLVITKQAADRIGKPLFVGEFGDPDAPLDATGSFTDRTLTRIVKLGVLYSAMWVWQFYQRNTYTNYDNQHPSYILGPGYSDRLIEKLKKANTDFGNSIPASVGPDSIAPRVVLTWPLECTQLKGNQKVHAVASDQGKIERVEFWLDGTRHASDYSPPYEFDVKTDGLAKGEHEIIARAYDAGGNHSEWVTRVLVGKHAPAGSYCIRN